MILRRVTLAAKLARLEEFVKYLKKLQNMVDRKRFLTDDIVRSAIERKLQVSLEAVLDICDHVINEKGFRKPEDYKDNIYVMCENGVLLKEFGEKFSGVAGFRNILVHDYVEIDNEKVYQHFKNDAGDIEKFMRHVVKYLKK